MVRKFEINLDLLFRTCSNIPKVSTCCCFLELDIGGTLMSVFGVVTGLLYIGRALNILYDVAHYEKEQEDDDALNNDDDSIWWVDRRWSDLNDMLTSHHIYHRQVHLYFNVFCRNFPPGYIDYHANWKHKGKREKIWSSQYFHLKFR